MLVIKRLDNIEYGNLHHEDFSGIMQIGVINTKTRTNKITGSLVPYNLQKGKVKIKVLLETEKQKLTVFTSLNSKGEVFNDLPKGGIFIPTLYNKTQKNDRNLKILVKCSFEQSIQ